MGVWCSLGCVSCGFATCFLLALGTYDLSKRCKKQGKLLHSPHTCSGAHAPRGEAVRRGEAVEHADILRRQELHKLSIVENFPLTVQDGGSLVRDVNNLPRDEGHRYSKYVLRGRNMSIYSLTRKVPDGALFFITS